ncbi:hypothetical protein [Fusibacter ferrireducens]|uniref:SpoOB alpha-helical domain-containing protein n=1 Tax=Fusibacter ferrireducens TaxID=2785058 RepID=A0ABS0A1J7_9FIRM|nr:hypothetical protein [Fusibacter ferrireducens]MBF4695734.1 hypothetical protein [Fusibacter ferrireducens]
MTFRLKQMIYGTMIIVSLYGISNGYGVKGLLLLGVVILGSYIIDRRQVRRYTIMILNKLYICLDLKAYDQMVEELRTALFFSPLRRQTVLFFGLMKQAYGEDMDLESWKRLNHWYVPYIWRIYSKVLLGDSLHSRAQSVISKYEQDYVLIIISVQEILKAPVETQKDALLDLRSKTENNLQFAWINFLISRLEIDPNKSAYYLRIATNIAPDFFGG